VTQPSARVVEGGVIISFTIKYSKRPNRVYVPKILITPLWGIPVEARTGIIISLGLPHFFSLGITSSD